jgi:hypothetical protein
VPSTLAALASALVLGAVAALHVHWALGGVWPGRDAESLARTVVGGPAGTPMPSPGACLGVALVLLGAAWVLLAASGLVAHLLPSAAVRALAWACAAVFALRGAYGFFDARVRPSTRGSRFERLNVIVYSPLCLGLALATVLVLRA